MLTLAGLPYTLQNVTLCCTTTDGVCLRMSLCYARWCTNVPGKDDHICSENLKPLKVRTSFSTCNNSAEGQLLLFAFELLLRSTWKRLFLKCSLLCEALRNISWSVSCFLIRWARNMQYWRHSGSSTALDSGFHVKMEIKCKCLLYCCMH